MITGYCIIRNKSIVRDGKVVYSGSGTLNNFLDDAYAALRVDYPKFYKMDNLSKLGFLAAEVILQQRSLTEEYSAESIALVLSNAHSSQDTDTRYLESTRTMASPALFVYTLPNIVAGEICIRHKIKGENAFFISPAFDPELLVQYVSLMLGTSIINASMSNAQCPNACLAGWIDVLGEQHDVFLYLLEKDKVSSLKHSAEQVKNLYNTTLWNS